jgi:plasmid stabilization system protein ParE
MSYSLVVSERAQLQLEKATLWFFEQAPGLEIKFLIDIDKAMSYIQKHPLKSQVRYKTVRIKFLKKFDFGIHYITENQTVFVLTVFHTSQNSEEWF